MKFFIEEENTDCQNCESCKNQSGKEHTEIPEFIENCNCGEDNCELLDFSIMCQVNDEKSNF